jgi:hypothetical protein
VAAQAAVDAGGGIEIAHAVNVCVAAALTFLIMKQVPAMAQGLASGVALSSFGAVSRLVGAGWGAARGVGQSRWQVVHGPFFCMAGNTDDWIAFVNSGVEEEEAQFDEDCTFTSLDRAIKAAVAEQRQTQDDLDNLPASKGGPT